MEITIEGSIQSLKEITPISYNVGQINSIVYKYKGLRDKSKAPTFALTYLGTWVTLMNNCGFPEPEAKSVEANFHNLYEDSLIWIKDKLDECCHKGYATVAFGLRIRTPLLAKSILNTSATARESSAEARSVGNAISGQSYGLLNNRAACAFMGKVWESEHKYKVLPVSLIHDAIYLLVKDDIHTLKWVNDHLIEEMSWQELPEIKHPKVKLEAALDIFYPTWADPITIDNGLSTQEIKTYVQKELKK